MTVKIGLYKLSFEHQWAEHMDDTVHEKKNAEEHSQALIYHQKSMKSSETMPG